MNNISTNELNALRMYLSYLHNNKYSYSSSIGKIFEGMYFISQEELYCLTRIEEIITTEIERRKANQ